MNAPSARTPALVAADWGTSNLRAFLLAADGSVIAEGASAAGIASVPPGGHEATLLAVAGGWPTLPVIMAGMVGSRQGWREAAYLPCPATPAALAERLLRFEASDGRPVAIVPGLMLRSAQRDGDVMRGEETQLAGLIASEAESGGAVILPGTHSKWATIAGGAIAGFQTFLTGELFALLSEKSFLRHSVAQSGDVADAPDFALGVRRTVEEGLPFLAAIFSVRARGLLGVVAPEANRAYLSGLLIGGEIAAARASGALEAGGRIRIVGARSLARAYASAFALLGRETETLDGSALVLRGLADIARRIGFLPEARA